MIGQPENPVRVRIGEVIATYPEDRLVDVKWIGLAGNKTGVVVTNSATDLSFPAIGDRGLILESGVYDYYLAKLEFDYAGKVAGTKLGPSGESLVARVVNAGETLIGSPLKNVFLSLTSGGDFSLSSGASEGVTYTKSLRWLTNMGSLVKSIGQGIVVSSGTVFRFIPGVGNIPIPVAANTPAVEHLIDLSMASVRFLRAHFGHVKDALGNDETSTLGSPLRVIIELVTAAVSQASINIDAVGNIESKSIFGENHVDGLAIRLGGTPAVQPVLKGTITNQLESAFLDAENALETAESAFQAQLLIYSAAMVTAAGLAAGPALPPQNQLAIAGMGAASSILVAAATAYMLAVSTYTAALAAYKGSLETKLSTKTFTS